MTIFGKILVERIVKTLFDAIGNGGPLSDGTNPPPQQEDWNRDFDWSEQIDHPDKTEVSKPPKLIYLPQPVDLPEIPQLPERRLPKEADGQTATATIGKSITVNEALKNKKFGQLLWNPVKPGKQKLRLAFDNELGSVVQASYRSGLTDYQKWIEAQINPEIWQGEGYKNASDKFWAGFALIRPGQLKGHQVSMGVAYGIDWISAVAQSYHQRSFNAFMPIRDWLYDDRELIDFQIERTNATKATDKNLELLSNASFFYRAGFHRLPAELPEFLIAPDPKEEEEKPQGERDKPVKIEDAMSLQEWLIKNIDALFGQFPIKIKIEDNELIKTGDQPLEISLPNLAETLAELTGKTLLNEAMINLLVNISFRLLNEQGSSKLEGHITNKMVEEIVDYLGFENKKVTEKIKFLYNPLYEIKEDEEPNFEEMLKESEIDIDVEELVEERTFEQKLDQLLFSAAIIQSALYEKVNPNDLSKWEGFTNEFKNMVIGFAGKKQEEKTDAEKEKKDAFDDFIEKVEEGFTQELGIQDSENPYLRKRDERPRIRRLGRPNTNNNNNGSNQNS